MEKIIFDRLGELVEKVQEYIENSYEDIEGLSLTEVHCIVAIENLEENNVTGISKALKMTRGGVTKLMKKLEKKELVYRYSVAENKKNVYFKLTSKGIDIARKHQKLHEEAMEREMRLFSENFTKNEQDIIVKFLDKCIEHTDSLI